MCEKVEIRNLAKSLLFTSLFCVVIAFTTQAIWPSDITLHLAISFGYGYSAVAIAHLLSRFAPQLSARLVNVFSLSGSMIFGTLHAYLWLSKYAHFSHFSAMKPVIFLGFVFTGVCFFYFYAHEQKLIAEKALEASKRRQSEQEKALILSQLQQLQSQIEPHFLFNTLANISVLIGSEPYKAQMMLEKLTDLLRGSLRSNRNRTTTLREELHLVDAYLGIQKIRLGDRLDYEIAMPGAADDIPLPPMLLQPLVENAVSHGIEPKAAGGKVTIKSEIYDEWFEVSVCDSGIGLQPSALSAGHGIALDNIRQRLSGLFADDACLIIAQNHDAGVTATIRIKRLLLDQLQGSAI